MPIVTDVVSAALADVPSVPAGEGAGASCLPDCRELDSAQEAADTRLRDRTLQPAQAFEKCQTIVSPSHWKCCAVFSANFVPYVKGMCHRHHRALDLPCGAKEAWLHPDDRSKPSDAVVWPHLASGKKHKPHSREETCIRQDDRCDSHNAGRHKTITKNYTGLQTRHSGQQGNMPRNLTRAV